MQTLNKTYSTSYFFKQNHPCPKSNFLANILYCIKVTFLIWIASTSIHSMLFELSVKKKKNYEKKILQFKWNTFSAQLFLYIPYNIHTHTHAVVFFYKENNKSRNKEKGKIIFITCFESKSLNSMTKQNIFPYYTT